MERTRAWSLVSDSRVAVLATSRADGSPRLVPCVLAVAGDTVYTPVDSKPKRTRELARLRDVERDPRAALLVHHWDEDWERLWWIRLEGRARILRASPELDTARRLLLEKYAQYTERAELDPVIAIDIESWRAWSASTER